MSILKVIKIVIVTCEGYGKSVKDIDLIDGLLLVSLENGTNFSLAYRFMTLEQIEEKTINACKWCE